MTAAAAAAAAVTSVSENFFLHARYGVRCCFHTPTSTEKKIAFCPPSPPSPSHIPARARARMITTRAATATVTAEIDVVDAPAEETKTEAKTRPSAVTVADSPLPPPAGLLRWPLQHSTAELLAALRSLSHWSLEIAGVVVEYAREVGDNSHMSPGQRSGPTGGGQRSSPTGGVGGVGDTGLRVAQALEPEFAWSFPVMLGRSHDLRQNSPEFGACGRRWRVVACTNQDTATVGLYLAARSRFVGRPATTAAAHVQFRFTLRGGGGRLLPTGRGTDGTIVLGPATTDGLTLTSEFRFETRDQARGFPRFLTADNCSRGIVTIGVTVRVVPPERGAYEPEGNVVSLDGALTAQYRGLTTAEPNDCMPSIVYALYHVASVRRAVLGGSIDSKASVGYVKLVKYLRVSSASAFARARARALHLAIFHRSSPTDDSSDSLLRRPRSRN